MKQLSLTTSNNPFQRALIEDALAGAEIPFQVRDSSISSTILGAANALVYFEFVVPADRLEEARDVLCANGIVCEVSERILRRTMDEVVRPLLGARDADLERLSYLVAINNKETVKALFEAIRREEGGPLLLEDLFMHLAREGSPALRSLARALKDGPGDELEARILDLAGQGGEPRLALLDVLSEWSPGAWRLDLLAPALRDPDPEVRMAGSDALFSLGRGDQGYDPDDPEDVREKAVQRLLERGII